MWKSKRSDKYKWAASSDCWFITWWFKKNRDVINYISDNQHLWIEFVGQIERGRMGHLHLQCVVWFIKPQSFDAVRKMFLNQAHIEVTMDLSKAQEYCMKERTRAGCWFTYKNRKLYCSNNKLEQVIKNKSVMHDPDYKEWI